MAVHCWKSRFISVDVYEKRVGCNVLLCNNVRTEQKKKNQNEIQAKESEKAGTPKNWIWGEKHYKYCRQNFEWVEAKTYAISTATTTTTIC